MKTFAQKLKEERKNIGLTQGQLAEKLGLSMRIITAYEKNEKKPRISTVKKLATFFGVSCKYLNDDECTDRYEEMDVDQYVIIANDHFGYRGAKDIGKLLTANSALFAGSDISQEEKDKFFEAVMESYVLAKTVARDKYSKK